jgi:hypothetical protein
MLPRRLTDSLIALVLTFGMAGCSQPLDDLPREPVSGTVMMDGQPLAEAVIQFTPTGATAKSPIAGANGEIKDGQFSIPREEGPVPGTYKVSISHAELKDVPSKGKVNTSIPQRNKKVGPEQIPADYNTKSKLEVEIKSGGAGDLKFELKSK